MQSYLCPKCHVETTEPTDVERMHCNACGALAADLRDELISELADPDLPPLTRRDCYSAALATLCLHCQNPGARLVHGFVRDSWSGALVAHAWVETPAVGTYEDGSTGEIIVVVDYTQADERARILPLDVMYQRAGVQQQPPPKRYTRVEAMAEARARGIDGPWQ